MDIVLVHPRIPQNTGSIARTCAATKTPLHIIEPIPFEISERTVQRAGLDYWPYVELQKHESWQSYLHSRELRNQAGTIWLISKFGQRIYHSAQFSADDALVFGNEETGLSPEIRAQYSETQLLRIPMPCTEVRSLNLSNAVSILLYEARRQLKLDESAT